MATMNAGPEPTRLRLVDGPDRHDLGGLAPGERRIIPVPDGEGGSLCVLQQAPASWVGEGLRARPTAAIAGWMGMCDDWVQYRRPDGAGGGVLYTGFFFNDPRTARSHSTVVQSPKVLLGPRYETGLILMNVSTWRGHAAAAEVSVRLHRPAGVRRTMTTIPAWAAEVLTVSQHGDQEGHGLLIAVSRGVTVLPIGFIRDLESGALAIDHTMPPGSFHDAWGDTDRRARWAAALV